MADGAGTSWCVDEGYFPPHTLERMNRQHREEAMFQQGHQTFCAWLWQRTPDGERKPCDCGKLHHG